MSDEATTVVEDLNQLRRSVSAFSDQNLQKRILPMEYFAYAAGVCND